MRSPLVYVTVLVIATCGLVYELVAGTLASYVLGDSVTQFSTVIGVYLSALGVGSYLSKYVQRALARRFVEIELAVALVGGASAPLLFLSFAYLPGFFRPVLYGIVLLVGTLVGLEIPLILRILRESVDFKELVAKVLTFDYLGALVASLLFPILLVPHLGLVRTSLLFGLLSAVVGLWSVWLFRPLLGTALDLKLKGVVAILILTVGFAYADRHDRAVRGRPVRRHRGLRAHVAVPAHRDHADRPRAVPALPERQPAVLVGRRVPLPRGPRAPGARPGAAGAPRAGPRRRRRPRGARDPASTRG